MALLSRIRYRWHIIGKNYHQMLLSGCIDRKLKAELNEKILYHKEQLHKLKPESI